jgi:hypothetical protein
VTHWRELPRDKGGRVMHHLDPDWPWPCSCDDCSRAAAAAWTADMSHVMAGEITLAEANRRADQRR